MDPDSEERIDVSIDVNDIEVQFDPNHESKIDLNEQYYIMMRYPTLKEVTDLSENADDGHPASAFPSLEKTYRPGLPGPTGLVRGLQTPHVPRPTEQCRQCSHVLQARQLAFP